MKHHKRAKVDLSKSLHESIQVKQRDNARYLLFRILDNGVPFDLTGKTVRFFGKKPDGKEIYNDMTITSATKGECELRLTSGALSTPGILQLEIEIKENEDVLTTFLLDVDIKKSLRSSSSIQSSNEYTVIEKIIETMKEWIEKAKDAVKRVDEAIKKIPPKEELIGPQGPKGDKGEKGDKGDPGVKGDKGDEGDTGFFGMKIKEDGHLYAMVNDSKPIPPLEIDERGHLIYRID
ncbi:BppU family phage baseplate upper protein [Clostridium sp.]|uniref:BppU family phage baseplate upper protein n=1 Tax=Clostridium sp. TaxID=1506 RepID=UPI00291124CB|nr:BppU family phage baseplate upper protein [Clostridium sp.]MDU6047117.1 BppU family phage baseplate upper protein [Clostridium sp.]MDU6220585.1 BppU family phage baseplate upper protein [Clostridium sp.]MDU6270932.1 BppU family phage baseplate upper protein [Clostridium sp.]MDU6326428.1 BppU family phage baseplate upper protein [Clostridium sp.]